MKRLTKLVDGKWIENHDNDERKAKGWKNGDRACMERLAAYEDTGLEPEEILTGVELANVYAAMRMVTTATAVWCRDCAYGKQERYQGGVVCMNPDSDWFADYPDEYSSCKFCKRKGV